MTTKGVEDVRRWSYETSEAIAPGWERQRDFIEQSAAPIREWMLRALAPQPGQTLLELAAGVGDTGFEAAVLVGESGRLISTDFSPTMVEAAGRRAAELGVENVEFRVMDAERIELADDSVDGVLCRFAYMLMPDPARALAETRRVLRPGGRLVLAVWGPPERNPTFAIPGMTLVEAGHVPPPDPEGPGIFSMGSEERTRTLLENAGFTDMRVEEVHTRLAFADIDEFVRIMTDTAGAIALALRGLSDDEREAFRSRLQERFAPFRADGGYALPGVALGAVAS